MVASPNTSEKKLWRLPWYGWAMVGIFVFSIGIRFWGLGRFPSFVFDEVYYAVFANNYLTHTKFFNAHPPLSQYIIAVGIWLGEQLPIGHDTVYNDVKHSFSHTTFSYRWFNAIFGSFIPPVVGLIAYQLTKRPTYMVIASLLMAMDGLFLVDSRYALNNVFLVFFGLLGQLLLLQGIVLHETQPVIVDEDPAETEEHDAASVVEAPEIPQTHWSAPTISSKRWLYFGGSGLFFGLSIACKWNGAWFLLGILLLLAFIIAHQLVTGRLKTAITELPTGQEPSVLVKLTHLKLWEIGVFLLIIPVLVYAVSWIPHLQQNPTPNFWNMQSEILHYHERVGNGKAVHPYCANWYTWPLMMRPLAYYYHVVEHPAKNQSLDTIYDVHAIGNPFLWWMAFAVIVTMTWRFFKSLLDPVKSWDLNATSLALPVFCLANYGANLFPWIRVTRCIYIYHYMGSLVFAVLGLAWYLDRWLHGDDPRKKAWGITAIFVIAAAFVWWMPIYLGLPLNRIALAMRMWFTSALWKEIGEMWNWI
jgi:dolichyl-phosphate-mannose-protein mannosyltransferase